MMFIFGLAFVILVVDATPVEQFISGNNLFAADVYKEQSRLSDGNIVVCPLSAELILGLTHFGAKGDTAEEIRTSLHFPNDKEIVKSALINFQDDLEQYKELSWSQNFEFSSANKIYLKNDFEIEDDFKELAADVFMAEVENIDFTKTEEAADVINNWVEEETNSKILNLIEADALDDATKAVLINAVYFKDAWFFPFDKTATKKINFTTVDKKNIEVDAMFSDAHSFFYYASSIFKFELIALPLETPGAFFTVLLPSKVDDFEEIEQQAEKIFATRMTDQTKIKVVLPKFKLSNNVDFTEILKNLGVNTLFTEEADLSGITGKKTKIPVDKVLQKSFVGVNEFGVEAAAATNMIMMGSSLDSTPPKQVVVNRPFMFYITLNNIVLFVGRVLNPNPW